MGLMENFGRVASTYMDEKDKLLVAGEKRQRERIGHAFWLMKYSEMLLSLGQ